MAYSEQLAEKIRGALRNGSHLEENKMMGGLTFMVNDKMCVGVLKDDLMVRLDPTVYDAALQKKGCREMNFTGRPMKGFVFVSPEGTSNEKDLNYWIDLALDFNNKAKTSKKRIRNIVQKEVIYMKTMTCKQLYGPCDVLIHGESSEEIIENSKKHAMEMAAKGDQAHIRIMESMKHHMDDPEAIKQWMEKFQNEFDAQPEDK